MPSESYLPDIQSVTAVGQGTNLDMELQQSADSTNEWDKMQKNVQQMTRVWVKKQMLY